jgi:hypothetical protein
MKKSIFILTLLLTTSQAELPKTFAYIDEKIPTIELVHFPVVNQNIIQPKA